MFQKQSEPDISQALKNASRAIQAIVENPNAPSYENTFDALEKALEPLQHAWGLVDHLDAVCNNPELRKGYNAMLPKVSAFFAKIPLNETLWQTLKAFAETSDLSTLSRTKRRHVAETMADFREHEGRTFHRSRKNVPQRFSSSSRN